MQSVSQPETIVNQPLCKIIYDYKIATPALQGQVFKTAPVTTVSYGEIVHGTVAPPPVVQQQAVSHHMQGRVNPKDIRETELYQENYPNERVFEGGTLAGMPLDSLNRPLATVS